MHSSVTSCGVALPIFAISLSLVGTLYATPAKTDPEKLIRALAGVNFGKVYFEDGAADGSVTDEQTITVNEGSGAFAPVRSILDLKDRAIPLLIEHLDDQQPTRTKFNGQPVPLGYVALDILMNVIGTNHKVFFTDCRDDGLGACVEPEYYFRPDADSVEMRKVKAHWQRLRSAGGLKFHEPSF
jgi:hypothetical protein